MEALGELLSSFITVAIKLVVYTLAFIGIIFFLGLIPGILFIGFMYCLPLLIGAFVIFLVWKVFKIIVN